MKTKCTLTSLAALALAAVVLGVSGCKKSGHEQGSVEPSGQEHSAAAKYTCSMHPEIVQDKSGDCPRCGMKLVESK